VDLKSPLDFERSQAMIVRIIPIAMIALLIAHPALAQFDQIFKRLGLGSQGRLSDVKIGSGLKEALKVGTENTVHLTGKTDGYFLN
jgi:hypothetical protein